ncbi:rhomboid family intramembrane serine protease [Candidatus Pacearchaeota archaeon]|nr:rhomboid family intramembrane serine protease [Candidatus Pacearchaeota archaeon]
MAVYQVYPNKRRSLFRNLSVNSNIILINVIVFFVFIVLLILNRENPGVVYDYLAIKPSNILQGKYLWTFLTSMFMHGGFFHLFVNMLSLFFVGSLVERILGAKRFLYFYLISGLFASLFFVLWSFAFSTGLDTFAVGASGALFGLVGLLMLLTPNLPVYVMFIPIPIKMKYAAPGILFILWLISVTGNVPIGNTAHLGGLIAGLIYGIYIRNKFPNKIRNLQKVFR